ncbi:CLUMA_CG020392, isoform A [Clunio marinus]|uniref:CLUMA_CG020392, isoform A n=1 Tax=Clunio marinus TaxID=568069 RepID=A0A1J1J4T9_9DIPT|nr:CLUMA_CG020392, isoform A [Clunio marinus]
MKRYLEIFLFAWIFCNCDTSHIKGGSARTRHSSTRNNIVCMTDECKKAAKTISDKIDNSVSPCENFYIFACGRYIKNIEIPEDKTVLDGFSVVRDVLQDQMRNIITAPTKPNEIEPSKMVKKLYSACLNKDFIEKRELDPIRNIHKAMGGWPAVEGDNWDEKAWSWQKAAINCRKYGYSVDYVIDFSVSTDLKNSSTKIIDIDQSDLGLSQVFLKKGIDHPVVSAYHSFQVDMAVLYGADRKHAEEQMREALEFEFGLANISLPSEKRRNASALYNPMTIGEVQKRFPYNDWKDYFNKILPETTQVMDDEVIVVYDIEFFEQLGKLLEETPKRAIANYIMWRVAAESTNYLTDKLRKRQLAYAGALIGQQTEEPRWRECINLVTSKFEIASAALYVREYFNEMSKSVALDMVNNIKQEFEKILKTIPWMDKQTKSVALDKVRNMVTHIGYPDELGDDKKLTEFYKNVTIDENKFLESILSINIFEADREYEKLRKSVNKSDWETHSKAAVVNAAYSPIENSIRFPAGILQGQFFSADRPLFMNYGAIGVVIGHEITHGFDDVGRQFDANGNLEDWWQQSTADAYLVKAKCIIDQYGNFTESLTGLNLNGINTQGENIADNGGVKEAYLAYQEYSKKHGKELQLPGLNYSVNQLFWIASAQTWCAKFRPEELQTRILTGKHSPNEFRVLGPFINMKEFSKDFNCPESSTMNPVERCEVW